MALNRSERPNIAQWGCLVLILGAIALTVVLGVWFLTRGPAAPDGPRPTAVVRTATTTMNPTPRATPTPEALQQPGTLSIGARVRVSGTGDAGLSMREAAGTTTERRDVAQEGEILEIVDGPEEADGYTWWFVRAETGAAREGWVAADFIVPAAE